MITLTQPCTMPEEQLTSTQQTALSSLILGNTVSEAAGEAGVHRNTVHRWLKNDEPFQAARQRAQRDARMAVEAKLHDTAMAAVECIEKCLQEGDAYVAEQLLKGLGCFEGNLKELGSDDAVALAREALQHSALSEMFTVGPGLPGQCETDSPSDRMAASNGIQTAELSGQARTYDVPEEMERYASVFSSPKAPDTNLHHDATSRRSGTPVPDIDDVSGTGCHDLREQHSATSDDGYADLTTQQSTAMMALQTGQTIEEAAAAAETDPATVYQWLRGDCTFQAAMNRCAGERRRSVHARLNQLASLAADVIDHRIRQGNGRMAVRLLKGLGYLDSRRTNLGSENTQDLIETHERPREHMV